MNWEIGIDIYTVPRVKQLMGSCCLTQGAHLGALWVGWGGRWEGEPRGKRYMHIHRANSLCCIAAANTAL